MLEVKDLHASIAGKEILKGINLTIRDGETHAIMGPNGSGKSTLSAVLVGNPLYEVTAGQATYNGKDLLAMKPEDRAHEGLFLSFQYPVEIPGVSMTNFMKAAINEKRKYEGKEPLNAAEFLKMMREKRKIVELDAKLSNRSVNEGFSGGEKKRNEIFQMAPRRDRFWPRRRRHAHRGRRGEQAAHPAVVVHRHHPLRPPARNDTPRCGARALPGTHREDRRS